MHFTGQRFVAALHRLASAATFRATSVPLGGASRQQQLAAVFGGLHNATGVLTAQQWFGIPSGGWAPVGLGFPPWRGARTVHASAQLRAAGDHGFPRALLVKAGDGFYMVLHPPPDKDITHFLGMDASTLLKTITGSITFETSMKGVAHDQCIVSWVTSTASGQPSQEELAQAKVLEGMPTLGETVGTAVGHVYMHIEALTRLSATGLRLPAPVTFKEAGLVDATGAPMHVAELPSSGPFFLEDRAYQHVLAWVRERPSTTVHKLLVLTGPIKSGKTALLNTVLPGVLAARYAATGGPKPVFFHFAFTLGHGPGEAALKLVEYAGKTARDLGFEIMNLPTTAEVALVALPRVMGDLAAGIAAGGGELVLLIDEAQAPVIAAKTPEDAAKFASTLKDMNTACRATSRVAITGSGMVALLNTLRMTAPNGYTLWGAMARVPVE